MTALPIDDAIAPEVVVADFNVNDSAFIDAISNLNVSPEVKKKKTKRIYKKKPPPPTVIDNENENVSLNNGEPIVLGGLVPHDDNDPANDDNDPATDTRQVLEIKRKRKIIVVPEQITSPLVNEEYHAVFLQNETTEITVATKNRKGNPICRRIPTNATRLSPDDNVIISLTALLNINDELIETTRHSDDEKSNTSSLIRKVFDKSSPLGNAVDGVDDDSTVVSDRKPSPKHYRSDNDDNDSAIVPTNKPEVEVNEPATTLAVFRPTE